MILKKKRKEKGLHQKSSGFSGQNKKQKIQTRTFSKMPRGPQQNGPVAHRWAEKHWYNVLKMSWDKRRDHVRLFHYCFRGTTVIGRSINKIL